MGAMGTTPGIDVGFRRPGGIDLVLADEELPQAHDLMAFNRERGCECEWLDAGRLRREEPHVSARAVGGVLFADDHQVNPEVLAEALLKAARSRGLEISFGTRLGSFERVRDDGVRVRLETASSSAVEVCDVDFVVLAAGAWSGPLGQLSGADPFIRAVGGQHCRFGGGRRLRHILRHGGYSAVPLGEQILAGATLEEEGYAMETTAAAREEITTSFRRMLALTPELLEQRAGLRPKPRRGRPVIGPLGSEASRVFVASGHYKNGVLLGPITGDLVAQWVLSGQPPRQMGAFAVRR